MASMRKNKKRLTTDALAALRAQNTERQDIALTEENIQRIGDDLVAGVREGMQEELSASSPAVQKMAERFGGILESFLAGFKEGVDLEIKDFVAANSESLKTTLEGIEGAVTETLQPLSEPVITSADPVIGKDGRHANVAKILERRPSAVVSDKATVGQHAGDFLTHMIGGMFGVSDYTDRKVTEREEKRDFIRTETTMRSGTEAYKGMSTSEIEKKISADYDVIKKSTEELKKIEETITTLIEQGYSEEAIAGLGHYEKQSALAGKITAADVSRLSAPVAEIPETAGAPVTPAEIPETAVAPVTPAEIPETTTIPYTVPSEETQTEQGIIAEKAADETEAQTILLSEIRDILKESQKKAEDTAAAPAESSSPVMDAIMDNIPDLPGRGGKAGKGGLFKRAAGAIKGMAGGAMKMAPNLVKGAGILGAGTAVYGGISDLAEGKAVESVGDVVPEGWDKLNPFSWANRAGMYAGEKINQGYGAVSSALGGGGSLGGDIFTGVDKLKGMLGGESTEAKAMAAMATAAPALNVSKGMTAPKPISATLATAAPSDMAAQIGKSIVVQSPPVIVQPSPAAPAPSATMPFTRLIRNTEPSLATYMRSRYVG